MAYFKLFFTLSGADVLRQGIYIESTDSNQVDVELSETQTRVNGIKVFKK